MGRIRALCTVDSFNRGMQYFKEGRVHKLRLSGGVVNAMVQGTRAYKVEINVDHGFESTCSCPYDFEGYCKHIVAALLAFNEDYPSIIDRGEVEQATVASALQGLDAEQLKDFLKKEFLRDKLLQDHFMIYATGEVKRGGKSVDDYKKEVDALYDDASTNGYIEYGNMIDFAKFTDVAERYIEKRNFAEAAKVFQALSEVIAENMDMVDDSDGYYGESFSEAIQSVASCVSSLEREKKSGYIDYFFEKFMEKKPDYFEEEYDEALRSVCVDKDDLEQLRELLWPHLPHFLPDSKNNWSRHYDSKVLLHMQAFVLDSLAKFGDEDSRRELYELFKKNYRKDEEFCLLYAEMLEKDGGVDEAIKVAEEGLNVFQPRLTTELRLFLNRHYETLSPERYKENLKKLFLQTIDWDFYEKLKKFSGKGWNSMLEEIVGYCLSSHDKNGYHDYGTILIDIYVREKMFEAALNEVLARKNLDILSRYYKNLAEKYPTDYFNAYRELLLVYADAKMGREHYREVASELKKMKAIRGFEKEFKDYIKMFKEKYAKRPAFIDEMKQL
jgi:hypothetical protein